MGIETPKKKKKSINFLVKQNVEEKEKQAPHLHLSY